VLLQFWTQVHGQLPLIDNATAQRPEDLLSALAAAGKDAPRPGKLLQQLGFVALVRSVGVRGAGAALSRHCSRRSWQRYKRELKTLPSGSAGAFSALRRVDEALKRFAPLRLKTFQASATQSSLARGAR
jgi:hypothetical protein